MRGKLSLLFCLFGLSGFAQTNNLSPYSRFGLGDLYRSGSFASYGLGGVGATWNDPFVLNTVNPASTAYLYNTTFQTGLRLQSVQLKEGNSSQVLNGGNIDQFTFAFKKAKTPTTFLFGLSPFSTSGYSITLPGEIDGIGSVDYKYDGSGGINKIYLGAGHRFDLYTYVKFKDKNGVVYDSLRVVDKSISLGANVNYLFGNIQHTRSIDISDVTFVDTRHTTYTRMFDFVPDLGAHYEQTLKVKYGSDKRLISRSMIKVGVVYTPSMRLRAETENYVESTITSSGVVLPIDTSYSANRSGRITLPSNLRAGIAFTYQSKEGRNFVFAADMAQRQWSQTEDGESILVGTLKDAREFMFGVEFTPRQIDYDGSLLTKANYRVGARLTPTYVYVYDTQITERAISAGFTLPLLSSRSTSKIHFGMELGKRGNNDGKLIQEDFANFYIGFSLSPFHRNLWFVQRKYE